MCSRPTVWMITNCKNGVSSWEIHRAIGVTQKTAWFMLHRIRLAMQDEKGVKLVGEVEVDESMIGGLSRGMKQKLAIACGLLHSPKVIYFDEPLTAHLQSPV